MSEFDNIIEMIKAVADKNRMRIMLMLSERPMCVCELDSVLGIALSTISAHLKQMRSAGVIVSEKEGRWVIYRIADNALIGTMIQEIRSKLIDDEEVKSDLQKIAGLCREACIKK